MRLQYLPATPAEFLPVVKHHDLLGSHVRRGVFPLVSLEYLGGLVQGCPATPAFDLIGVHSTHLGTQTHYS